MKEENKKKLNEEIPSLAKLSGQERGVDIKYLVEYVKKKEGENGLKELKIMLAEEYNFFLPDLDKITDVEWISESIPHIFLIASVRFFDWNKEDVYEMGRNATTYSITFKMFIRYFASIKQTIQGAANGWNEYYTNGKMKMIEFNKEEKKSILELQKFKTHPLVCIYVCGAIAKILELVTGSKKAKVRETKCMFKGSNSHEFELTW